MIMLTHLRMGIFRSGMSFLNNIFWEFLATFLWLSADPPHNVILRPYMSTRGGRGVNPLSEISKN